MDENKPDSNLEKLARHFEKANFGDYVDLLNRPWKLFWINVMAGIARGLGIAVGMTAVFALVTFVLINFLKSLSRSLSWVPTSRSWLSS